MTNADLAAALTGETLTTKDTGAGDRSTRDEIAQLAYEFYEARGQQDGRDVDDWLRAEQQLIHHYR